MLHFPCINHVHNVQITNTMRFTVYDVFHSLNSHQRRSYWPCSLRRSSAVARLLRSWVRIPPGAWMFVVSIVCCRSLRDERITSPEESCRLWWVVVCDLGTSWMNRRWPKGGSCAKNKFLPACFCRYCGHLTGWNYYNKTEVQCDKLSLLFFSYCGAMTQLTTSYFFILVLGYW